MYEYAPKTDKRAERLIFLALLAFAAINYVSSMMPFTPFPALFQLVAFVSLAIAIIVIGKYMLCRYIYRVEPSESAPNGEMDLVITECVRQRKKVVCRIERSAVVSVTCVTKENRQALSSLHKGKQVFRYTGELFPKNCALLEIVQDETQYFLYILCDEALEKAILNI